MSKLPQLGGPFCCATILSFVLGAQTSAQSPLSLRVERAGDQLRLAMPTNALEKEYLLVTRLADAPPGTLYADSRVSSRIVYLEAAGSRIFLRERALLAWARPDDRSAATVRRQNTDPILGAASATAGDSLLRADVTSWFVNPGPEPGPGGGMAGTVDATRSFVVGAHTDERSTEIDVVLTLTTALPPPANVPAWVPQPRSTARTLRLHWSIMALRRCMNSSANRPSRSDCIPRRNSM